MSGDGDLSQAIGVLGPYTQRAVEHLKKGTPGETITQNALGVIIGRDISSTTCPAAGNVRTAMKRVRRIDNVWWIWDRQQKVYRCLTPHEAVTLQNNTRRLRAKGLKGDLTDAMTIDADKLDSSALADHKLNQVHFLMGHQATSTAFRKRMKDTGAVDQLRAPDPQKLIGLMRDGA
jgi:hypothetical protein